VADIYKRRFGELKQQLEKLLASRSAKYDEYLGKSQVEVDSNALLEWTVKARNLLVKACGLDSEHYKQFNENDVTGVYETCLSTLERLSAIFLAAKEDYEGGYLRSIRSLIQAEVFESELEQAEELLRSGYKSPSAVVAGVVLETSLRDLCDQHGIPHAKLDKMNSDLAKVGVYNKLRQKQITALAGIRNSAAHGKPDDFSEQDVKNMIGDIERIISEHL